MGRSWRPLRIYIAALYLATAALCALQLRGLRPLDGATLAASSVFLVVSTLLIRHSAVLGTSEVGLENIATTAACLSLPPPLPLLLAALSSVGAEIGKKRAPHKQLYNVAQVALQAGVASGVYRVLAPASLHGADLPRFLLATAAASAVDILLNMWLLHVAVELHDGRYRFFRRAWFVDPTYISLAAGSAWGVVAVLLWHLSPLLLILLIVPLIQIRTTQRAQQRAHERAAAIDRHAQNLERILDAGQTGTIERASPAHALATYASAAAAIAGVERAHSFLATRDDGVYQRIADADGQDPAADRISPGEIADGRRRGQLWLALDRPGSRPMGYIALGDREAVRPDTVSALHVLATQAALALGNLEAYQRIAAQVRRDGLTGLPNQRAFHDDLHKLLALASPAHPIAVLFIDLDNLAALNAATDWGHGDALLIGVGAALTQVACGSVVARYGGDEFALLLSNSDDETALEMAQAVCRLVATLPATQHDPRPLTASVGVVTICGGQDASDAVLQAARRAMRAARARGGDGVGTVADADRYLIDVDPAVVTQQLAQANMDAITAFAAAVDAKDPYTHGHSQRVARYSVALARAAGYDTRARERIHLAGLLHDVGKIAVPDAVLLKPDRLTDEEFAAVKKHPAKGEEMLRQLAYIDPAILPAVRGHHERWDGRGYPDGLVGHEIHSDAALMAVADAFDAMTSNRPYRQGLPVDEAIQRIRAGAGAQFAPTAVAAFEHALAWIMQEG